MIKKNIYLFAICATALAVFQSCEREEETKIINRAVDVNLNMNETYNLTMMEDVYGDELEISKQAAHFSTSSLAELPKQNPKDEEGLESSAYTYTPAKNFVGNDEVTLTGEGEHIVVRKCGNEPRPGKDDDEEFIVNTTIRFHIVPN